MYASLIIIFVVVYLYYLLIKHLTYWERNGVPQDSMLKVIKTNLSLIFNPKSTAIIFDEYCKSFPNHRYFGIYYHFQKSLVIQDPELVKQFTVRNFSHFSDHSLFDNGNYEPLWNRSLFSLKGQEWKGMRNILNPCFSNKRMKLMFDVVLKCSKQFVNHFAKKLEKQSCVNIDIQDSYVRYASDLIAEFAYGYSCDSFNVPENDFYVNGQLLMPTHTFLDTLRMLLVMNFSALARFCGLTFYPKAGSDFFLNIISKNVKVREEKNIERPDLINSLLEARKLYNIQVSDIDITAQALIFYFGGVDTVSSTLSFMSHELALHRDVQKRVQQEVDDILIKCNGTLTYEAIKELNILDMVISETMRMWPAAVLTERKCTSPYVIEPQNPGEVPVNLKKGDILWFPLYTMHRNPDVFHQPDEFIPERFSKENKISPYVYMPFGAGPRQCVARSLAIIEIKTLLFCIMSKFDIVPVEKTQIPIRLSKSPKQLSAEKGFWLGLKLRQKE